MLLGSLTLRPYVFLFLAVYLVVSGIHLGYLRTAILFFLTWGIAFLSEFAPRAMVSRTVTMNT